MNIVYEYIEEYIQGILKEDSDTLEELKDYARINNVPIISPEIAQLLRLLLKISKAKDILEIGTAIGYSSLVMAEATGCQVKIDTIEIRDDMYEIAIKNIKKSKYNKKINVIQGDAKEIILNLDQQYDFIFLDAAKGHYLDFFNHSIRKLKAGGLIVSDNVLYKGMVASDELIVKRKSTIVKRMRNYLEYISELEGYVTSIIPIGDGIALTYKEGLNLG